MAEVVLVTGTDTGVGKTWVGCALARALVATGVRVIAVKPVETGCAGAHPDREDGVLLAAATGQAEPRHALRRLRTPVSAAQALEREGVTLDFDDLVLELERLAVEAEVLVVEGAGGLLSPMTWEWNVADLAATLSARAIIVGRDHLGTINHTLLTVSAAELAGLRVLGVVLTSPRTPDASTGENGPAIARLSGVARVHVAPWTDDPLAAAAAMRDVAEWVMSEAPSPDA